MNIIKVKGLPFMLGRPVAVKTMIHRSGDFDLPNLTRNVCDVHGFFCLISPVDRF